MKELVSSESYTAEVYDDGSVHVIDSDGVVQECPNAEAASGYMFSRFKRQVIVGLKKHDQRVEGR